MFHKSQFQFHFPVFHLSTFPPNVHLSNVNFQIVIRCTLHYPLLWSQSPSLPHLPRIDVASSPLLQSPLPRSWSFFSAHFLHSGVGREGVGRKTREGDAWRAVRPSLSRTVIRPCCSQQMESTFICSGKIIFRDIAFSAFCT